MPEALRDEPRPGEVVRARVDRLRRRFARAIVLRAAARGLVAGGALDLALAVVSRFLDVPALAPALGLAPLAFAIVSLALALRTIPRVADAALLLDRTLGTREAVVAAIERPESAAVAGRAAAILAAAPADPRPQASSAVPAALVVLALAAAVLVFVPRVAGGARAASDAGRRGGVTADPEMLHRIADRLSSRAGGDPKKLSDQEMSEALRDLAAAAPESLRAMRADRVADLVDRTRGRAAAEKALEEAMEREGAPDSPRDGAHGAPGGGDGSGAARDSGALSPEVAASLEAAAHAARRGAANDRLLDEALQALEKELSKRPLSAIGVAEAARKALSVARERLSPEDLASVERQLRGSRPAGGTASASGPDLLTGPGSEPGAAPPASDRPLRAIPGEDSIDPRYEWLVRRYFSEEPTPDTGR